MFQLEIARRSVMAVREEFGYAKRKLKEEVAERGRVREEVAQRRGHLEKTWRKWVAPRGSSCNYQFSFIHLFIRSFIHSCMHLIYSLTHSLFKHSFIHAFIQFIH